VWLGAVFVHGLTPGRVRKELMHMAAEHTHQVYRTQVIGVVPIDFVHHAITIPNGLLLQHGAWHLSVFGFAFQRRNKFRIQGTCLVWGPQACQGKVAALEKFCLEGEMRLLTGLLQLNERFYHTILEPRRRKACGVFCWR
jgi:hypothetical protein